MGEVIHQSQPRNCQSNLGEMSAGNNPHFAAWISKRIVNLSACERRRISGCHLVYFRQNQVTASLGLFSAKPSDSLSLGFAENRPSDSRKYVCVRRLLIYGKVIALLLTQGYHCLEKD